MNKQYERFLDKSVFYTETDFVKMYGQNYRIFLNHDLLIKDEEVFNTYKASTPTVSSNIQGNQTTVSKTLLLDLLNNEGMYQYLFQNMDNDFGNVVRISLFKDDNKIDSIIISRAVLSDLLLSLPKEELTEKEQMRIALITNVSTLNSLRMKYRDDIHFGIIDDASVSIPSVDLFNILTMSKEKYNVFINSEEFEIIINGEKQKYSTRVIAYMIVSFMERERILAKYLIPDIVYQRYTNLKNLKNIDFESINKNEKSNDYDQDGISRADLVKLSDELQTVLDIDIPKTSSILEQAIIKYIKLLSVLKFNQEYYAANVSNQPASDIESINAITLDNNEILPNDLLVIITYIFKSLGIKYTVEHQKVSFKYGEYVLELNMSNEAILHDMFAVKLNEAITSIRCVNINNVTKSKFNELLSKINYRYLINDSVKNEYKTSLEAYKSLYVKDQISRKERISLFFKIISSSSLMGTDHIFYQMKLFKQFFKDNDGISINVISSSMNSYRDYQYVPVTVISVLNGNEYVHYVIDVNSKEIISNVSTYELRNCFEDKSFAYLDIGHDSIPGVMRSRAYVR